MEENRKNLVDFIRNALPVAEDRVLSISSSFEAVHAEKNDYLLKIGQVSNDFFYLESGFLRTFTYDARGNEVTTGFYKAGALVADVVSFFKQKPALEDMQALSASKLWRLNYAQFQVWFHTVPEFREFGRANLVNGFIALKERTLSMINLTAEQRYENLLRTRPEIFQQASLKHIASYLGITDTSLSRIRKEIVRK